MNRLFMILAMLVTSSLCLRADEKSNSPLSWLKALKLIEMPSASTPVVCVPISASSTAGEKTQVSYAIGFLEQDDGKSCKVWLTNFERRDFSRNSWQRYGVDPDKTVRKLTALEAAKLWCEWLDTESPDTRRARVGWPMEEFARMIVLATVFQQRGETEAAGLLERRAMSLPRNGGGDWPSDRNFDRDLKENLAQALMNSVKSDGSNPKYSRTIAEERLTQIAQHFPDTKEAGEATSLAKGLRAVIESEALAEKNKLTDEALAKLPMQERIATLIQMLPDQTGHQWMMPGYCDIFIGDPAVSSFIFQVPADDPRRPKIATTPAGKLFLIGLEAVPQLIEATEDRRPTRAFGLGKPNWQRSSLLDVGDCAFQILQRLSGRSFYGRELSSDPAIASAEMKRNAQTWWEEVQNGTEAEKLDQEISQGGGGQGLGYRPARLAEIAPERIVGAIERGLENAENSWNADWLVSSLAMVDTAPARELMQRQITEGRYLSVRMTAARFVHQSSGSFNGKPSPVYSEADQQAARQAMLQEWKKFPGSSERHEPFDGSKLAELIASMAIKSPSMFPAISAELPFHTPDMRSQLINNLTAYSRMIDQKPSPSLAFALEPFLAGQLEDEDFAPTVSFQKSTLMNGRGARVAEFAVNLLHQLWPERYPFIWDAPATEIENARIVCLNAWRLSQQLPAIVPAAPPLGDKDDPATVTKITLGKNSQALPTALKPQVDAWLNKPLSEDSIISFLANFAKANKEDTLSLSLTATRSSARSGFTVELTIGNKQASLANGNHHLYVIVDGKHLMQTSGGLELHLAQRSDLSDYTQFKEHIATALTAPASAPIFIESERLTRSEQYALQKLRAGQALDAQDFIKLKVAFQKPGAVTPVFETKDFVTLLEDSALLFKTPALNVAETSTDLDVKNLWADQLLRELERRSPSPPQTISENEQQAFTIMLALCKSWFSELDSLEKQHPAAKPGAWSVDIQIPPGSENDPELKAALKRLADDKARNDLTIRYHNLRHTMDSTFSSLSNAIVRRLGKHPVLRDELLKNSGLDETQTKAVWEGRLPAMR